MHTSLIQDAGRRRLLRGAAAATALAFGVSSAARAAASAESHEHHDHHGHHDHPLPKIDGVKTSVARYEVPDLMLVREDGTTVSLRQEMDDGRAVALNFIYTTCTAICPLMSEIFREFQSRLGGDVERIHMMSISIDPEQDTPRRLRDYAQRFSAGRQWQHYTGSVAASVAVQRAFNAYRGDKMNHDPVTLMRPAPGRAWLRLDGFATGVDLAQQYASLGELCKQNVL